MPKQPLERKMAIAQTIAARRQPPSPGVHVQPRRFTKSQQRALRQKQFLAQSYFSNPRDQMGTKLGLGFLEDHEDPDIPFRPGVGAGASYFGYENARPLGAGAGLVTDAITKGGDNNNFGNAFIDEQELFERLEKEQIRKSGAAGTQQESLAEAIRRLLPALEFGSKGVSEPQSLAAEIKKLPLKDQEFLQFLLEKERDRELEEEAAKAKKDSKTWNFFLKGPWGAAADLAAWRVPFRPVAAGAVLLGYQVQQQMQGGRGGAIRHGG